jgi:hypothetical protein
MGVVADAASSACACRVSRVKSLTHRCIQQSRNPRIAQRHEAPRCDAIGDVIKVPQQHDRARPSRRVVTLQPDARVHGLRACCGDDRRRRTTAPSSQESVQSRSAACSGPSCACDLECRAFGISLRRPSLETPLGYSETLHQSPGAHLLCLGGTHKKSRCTCRQARWRDGD